MNTYELEGILKGWNQAEGQGVIGPLFGGQVVPDVDILVDDGTFPLSTDDRDVVGTPRMAWATPESMRYGQSGRLTVVASRTRFSGANRHRQGTMRSISLFHHFRNDAPKLEMSAILAALVGVRNARPELTIASWPAVEAILKILDFQCLQDIWARASSAPMPVSMPAALKAFDAQKGSAVALGRLLRLWHDIAFRRLVAVCATPVRGGMGTLTLSDFEEITDRYAVGLHTAHGGAEWKSMTRLDLEALVWKEPRSQLMLRLDVSDVAISKRCRREGISTPPRGYWQRLDAEIDPRPLLEKSGVSAPLDIMLSLALRFEVECTD